VQDIAKVAVAKSKEQVGYLWNGERRSSLRKRAAAGAGDHRRRRGEVVRADRRSITCRWSRSPSSSSSGELLHRCSSSSRWRHAQLPRERRERGFFRIRMGNEALFDRASSNSNFIRYASVIIIQVRAKKLKITALPARESIQL
jgi:hypothetical protein